MLKLKSLLVLGLLLFTDSSVVYGQAYCALRDPTRIVYQVYPEATSYRSIVRTVNEEVRNQVAKELPFTIHFNELGKHTLYVPVKSNHPLGLIHVRSEPGRWGLVEIIWSLDPSLRVQGYTFQRCRSSKRTAVETDIFKRQLIGKDFRQLRSMLSDDGKTVKAGSISVPPGAEDLATALVHSALKTIAVTRLSWANDLRVIRPLYFANKEFPNSQRVQSVGNGYSPIVQAEIAKRFPQASNSENVLSRKSMINRKAVKVIRLSDDSGQTLGHLIRTPWHSLEDQTVLWWTVSKDLKIKNVFPEEGWPSNKVESTFVAVKGLSIDQLHKCSTAAEIVGAEVLLLGQGN